MHEWLNVDDKSKKYGWSSFFVFVEDLQILVSCTKTLQTHLFQKNCINIFCQILIVLHYDVDILLLCYNNENGIPIKGRKGDAFVEQRIGHTITSFDNHRDVSTVPYYTIFGNAKYLWHEKRHVNPGVIHMICICHLTPKIGLRIIYRYAYNESLLFATVTYSYYFLRNLQIKSQNISFYRCR